MQIAHDELQPGPEQTIEQTPVQVTALQPGVLCMCRHSTQSDVAAPWLMVALLQASIPLQTTWHGWPAAQSMVPLQT